VIKSFSSVLARGLNISHKFNILVIHSHLREIALTSFSESINQYGCIGRINHGLLRSLRHFLLLIESKFLDKVNFIFFSLPQHRSTSKCALVFSGIVARELLLPEQSCGSHLFSRRVRGSVLADWFLLWRCIAE
jgi:hypothetical protein